MSPDVHEIAAGVISRADDEVYPVVAPFAGVFQGLPIAEGGRRDGDGRSVSGYNSGRLLMGSPERLRHRGAGIAGDFAGMADGATLIAGGFGKES